MEIDALVAEIGSTTTVVNAFINLKRNHPKLWAQGQAPTTVEKGDVRIGLQNAIKDLCRKRGIKEIKYNKMFAASSAAGGLRMTVHGVAYEMTARAAKEAALGAGGIIRLITAGKLRTEELKQLCEEKPNLILLAGGIDGGDRKTTLYNAEKIRELELNIPVIYAGNIENQEAVKQIFHANCGQPLYLADNVYPKMDTLQVEACRRVIQQVFEQHITQAPGMEYLREIVDGPIIPTPGAVMESTRLLYEYLGPVLTLDIGGATTDVHAVCPESDMVKDIISMPEPLAKRTVEGDLGIYVNRKRVIESIGYKKLEAACENAGYDLQQTLASYQAVPKNSAETWLAETLATEAALQAIRRHAGQLQYVMGPLGRQPRAEGKDLTEVKYIIGTGGALTKLPHRESIIKAIENDNLKHQKLYPEKARILIDRDYIMASLGVLSLNYRNAAACLLLDSLGISQENIVHSENI